MSLRSRITPPTTIISLLCMALLVPPTGCSESSGNGEQDASDGSLPDGRDGDVDGADDMADGGDTGADPGGDDGGAAGDDGDYEDPWLDCPTGADYQGGGWSAEMTLEVTDQAIYCFTFDSTITAEDQMPLKNMIRFHPGTYGLPAEAGIFDLVLPACVRIGREGRPLTLDGAGSVEQEIDVAFNYYYMDFCQPMRTEAGEPWGLRITMGGSLPAPGENLVFDDRSVGRDGAWAALLRDGCSNPQPLRYQSCHYDWIEPQRNLVRFDGGEITLNTHLPQIDATVFGLFSRASGILDGTSFDQQSYWNLAFHSMLHFFFCDFIVLFDRPVGPACGLKIDELIIWSGETNPERKLMLIDCALDPIEERTILSAEQLP